MKKVIRLTESDLTRIVRRVIEEQSDMTMDRRIGIEATNVKALGGNPNSYSDIKSYRSNVYGEPLTGHEVATILQIGTAFIPLVGPLISAGIGLLEAKAYYDEGDTKTAGLVALFSVIPGIGGLAGKLGLTGWTAKILGEIGRKISQGLKLTKYEVAAATRVAQNKDLILSQAKAVANQASKQTTKEVLKQTGKQAAKTVGGYAATGAAYSKGYDTVQKDTPKSKAESEGLDWNFVKTAFGSSGTEQENKLLSQAWNKGWRPGKIVPTTYQTKKYQENYAEEVKNLNTLQTLITQAV